VLLFETLLETYRYIALGIAGTSTLDHHHRLNMAGERITTWLQAPDTLAELHRLLEYDCGRNVTRRHTTDS